MQLVAGEQQDLAGRRQYDQFLIGFVVYRARDGPARSRVTPVAVVSRLALFW